MKVQQKIFTLILVVVIALATLGWTISNPAAHGSAFAQCPTGSTPASVVSGAHSEMAAALPSKFPPGIIPHVSWNS